MGMNRRAFIAATAGAAVAQALPACGDDGQARVFIDKWPTLSANPQMYGHHRGTVTVDDVDLSKSCYYAIEYSDGTIDAWCYEINAGGDFIPRDENAEHDNIISGHGSIRFDNQHFELSAREALRKSRLLNRKFVKSKREA